MDEKHVFKIIWAENSTKSEFHQIWRNQTMEKSKLRFPTKNIKSYHHYQLDFASSLSNFIPLALVHILWIQFSPLNGITDLSPIIIPINRIFH